ncbi:MAG: class I SAM-dependent methyltransferase [Myxococcales bacterium]|nr:class I SAM-dependent methyltransferase [Myxococcales bacterium]
MRQRLNSVPRVQIDEITSALVPDQLGIWRAPSKQATPYPEEGHSIYFEIEDRSFWFRHRNDCIAAVMRRHPPEGPLVDIGGGNGFVCRRLLDEGFDAILLEPGDVGARNASVKRKIPQVICATLEDSGIRPASLPAASLFDVLEHFEDDRGFLARIRDLLAPGGLLYVTVPAHQALWSAADVDAQHARRYNERQLRELIAPDFEMRYFTYFFGPLVLPIFVARTIPHRLGARGNSSVRAANEHGVGTRLMAPHGIAVRAMSAMLRPEVGRLAGGGRLSFGASCLFVARKRG